MLYEERPEDVTPISNDQIIAGVLQNALSYLRDFKPGDRSNKDRYYAVAITEMEKLEAFFEYHIIQGR